MADHRNAVGFLKHYQGLANYRLEFLEAHPRLKNLLPQPCGDAVGEVTGGHGFGHRPFFALIFVEIVIAHGPEHVHVVFVDPIAETNTVAIGINDSAKL